MCLCEYYSEDRLDMLGPRLCGNIICLAPLETEDLERVRSWLSEPEVTNYWGTFQGYSERQMAEWYRTQTESNQYVRWRITLDGSLIGMTVIEGIDWKHRHADTGIMLGEPSAWRKGCASEAIQLRTRYAFQELGLERLGSMSMKDNHAMHRVLQKAGYRNIGRMRRYFYRNGRWHDVFLFELLRDEWIGDASRH